MDVHNLWDLIISIVEYLRVIQRDYGTILLYSIIKGDGMSRWTIALAGITLTTMAALPVLAGGPSGGVFSIPWSTIDGGGAINTSGGSFALSGTIGQPDASDPMTGGSFSLTGGFWAGVSTAAPCPADLNGDGALDFFDISFFLSNTVDFNNDTVFDFFDISAFLTEFSAGCP